MIWSTILGALVPVASNGLSQLITRWAGGVKPTSVAEQIQLDEMEIKRLQAVAALDVPGGVPSQWVVDLRASARYVGALVTIAAGLAIALLTDFDVNVKSIGLEAANVAFGFLFGSRIVANFTGKK